MRQVSQGSPVCGWASGLSSCPPSGACPPGAARTLRGRPWRTPPRCRSHRSPRQPRTPSTRSCGSPGSTSRSRFGHHAAHVVRERAVGDLEASLDRELAFLEGILLGPAWRVDRREAAIDAGERRFLRRPRTPRRPTGGRCSCTSPPGPCRCPGIAGASARTGAGSGRESRAVGFGRGGGARAVERDAGEREGEQEPGCQDFAPLQVQRGAPRR